MSDSNCNSDNNSLRQEFIEKKNRIYKTTSKRNVKVAKSTTHQAEHMEVKELTSTVKSVERSANMDLLQTVEKKESKVEKVESKFESSKVEDEINAKSEEQINVVNDDEDDVEDVEQEIRDVQSDGEGSKKEDDAKENK